MLREHAKNVQNGNEVQKEIQQKRVAQHEKMRKLIVKAAHVFMEVQRVDEEEEGLLGKGVGMGGGVGEFLEGR